MFEGKGSPLSKTAGFNLPIAALALAATLLGVHRAEADLLVSSRLGGNNGILRYDETTGAYLGRFADEYQADVQIEESNPALLYFGAWQTISDERASGGAYRRSNQRDASVQFEPASRNIRWLTTRGPDRGIARVFIKDVLFGEFDLYAPTEEFQVSFAWEDQIHAIRVVVTGNHSGKSTGANVDIDAFAWTEPRSLSSIAFGPDRNLYAAGGDVVRYDGHTGQFIDVFASVTGRGGATSIAFGPDGNLYVSNCGCRPNAQNVLRYDGATGEFIDVFASGGGLSFPRGLAFGEDRHLYVVSYNNGSVLRYDGTTGEFMDPFVPEGSGGLVTPNDLVFGPDGHLYVTGAARGVGTGALRYDGKTGDFIDLFASTDDRIPFDLQFGPNGNL